MKKMTLPTRGDPLVREMFKLVAEHPASAAKVAARAGLSSSVWTQWRRGVREPRLLSCKAILNVVGYDLVVAPLRDD